MKRLTLRSAWPKLRTFRLRSVVREEALWYLSALAGAMAVNVIALPVLLSVLDVTAVGGLLLALVSAQTGGLVIGGGLPAGLTLLYFRADPARSLRVASAALSSLLRVSTATLALTVGGHIAGLPPQVLMWPLFFVVGLAWAGTYITQSILRAGHRARGFAVATIGMATAPYLGGCTVVVATTSSPHAFAIGAALGALVLQVIAKRRLGALSRSHARDDPQLRSDFFAALKVGAPTIPHGISLFLVAGGMRYSAAAILDVASAASVHAAYLVGGASVALVGAVNNIWNISYYEACAQDGGLEYLRRSTRALQLSSTATSCAVVFVARPALEIIAPELLSGDLLIAATIMATASPLMVSYLARMHVLVYRGQTAPLAVITPLSVLSASLVAAALATRFGLSGIALTVPLAYATLATVLGLDWRTGARPTGRRRQSDQPPSPNQAGLPVFGLAALIATVLAAHLTARLLDDYPVAIVLIGTLCAGCGVSGMLASVKRPDSHD